MQALAPNPGQKNMGLGGVMNYRAVAAAAIAVAFLTGCQSTVRKNSTATFDWSSPNRRVVLVEPDVELGSLEAAGSFEARADWTAIAQGFIAKDIADHLPATACA